MTWRAFLIGLAAVALIGAVTPWNDFDKGNTFFTGNHFPAGAVAILLVLTLVVNVGLKLARRAVQSPADPHVLPARRAWALTHGELMLVWCMMIVSCTVPASGLMRYWFSICASPAYYSARADLPYKERVLKDVPRDLVLTKDPKSVAAKRFFDGMPPGEDARIPWVPWLRPMVAWGVFILLFYLATFFANGLLRKQWVDTERLIFPLARVPMEFTEDAGQPGLLGGVARNKWFLGGAGLTLIFAFMRASPVLTGAEVGWRPEVPTQDVLWGTPLQYLDIWSGYVYPIAIGFAFLVPSDISLSIWFFFVFTRLENQFSYWMGQPIQGSTWGPFMAWQQAGSYIVFVLMMLWTARRHLTAVFRKAVGLGKGIDDSPEPIGYRIGFWGLVASVLGMAAWFAYYGMDFFVALVLLGLMLILVLGLTRLIAQGGVFFLQQRWQPPDLLNAVSGGRAFSSTAAIVAQMQNSILIYDSREILSGHATNALRIASVFDRHRRLFLPAMLAALAVGVGVGAYATLHTYYKVGGYNISNPWGTRSLPIETFDKADRMISNPAQSAETHYGPMALGAAIMFFVTFMRGHFYWWPLHSLGFLLAASYAAHTLWFSFLLGWLTKVLTLKFAGGNTLRGLRSFFVGVVIAESFAIAASTALGLLGVKLGFIFLPE